MFLEQEVDYGQVLSVGSREGDVQLSLAFPPSGSMHLFRFNPGFGEVAQINNQYPVVLLHGTKDKR